MKYNGFYYWICQSSIKKVLLEKYDKEYATQIAKKSKRV